MMSLLKPVFFFFFFFFFFTEWHILGRLAPLNAPLLQASKIDESSLSALCYRSWPFFVRCIWLATPLTSKGLDSKAFECRDGLRILLRGLGKCLRVLQRLLLPARETSKAAKSQGAQRVKAPGCTSRLEMQGFERTSTPTWAARVVHRIFPALSRI